MTRVILFRIKENKIKKLLVLSASAILASNFIFDNNASALVKETKHKSEALSVVGNTQYKIDDEDYKKHLEKLIFSLSLNDFTGYDELEYKEAYEKYQDRFLSELDTFNRLTRKEDPQKIGLTVYRYNKIYESLKQNKEEFIAKAEKIENSNNDLMRFNDWEIDKALDEVYELEDKLLMVANVFYKHKEAKINMYNKRNLIMAYTKDENGYRVPLNIPRNKRMLNEIKEDLETIIDEFFEDIELARPVNIPKLTDANRDDMNTINKIKKDAEDAKLNPQLVDPGVKERAKKTKEKLAKITENSRKAKDEAEQKAKEKLSNKYKSYLEHPEEFKHKKLKQPTANELSIKFPESSPEFPIYKVTTESKTQPVLKQQTKEEKVDVLKSKRPETTLNGLNGESNLVTIDESANASTQFGSNGHVFEYSFDSTPKTTNVAKQNVKQENYNSVNNLAGMSGESQHVDFTQDSHPTTTYGGYGNAFDLTEDTAPKQPETITESHEIVLDYQTHATMSGFKTGESTEAYYSSNELTK
ncbi:hypothetical protein MTQ87_10110 [Staphylococcus hyicus]|uniref:coagulase domain-containing protein n=1 Tax=Staphylococcus hyicus TaxID=1284 RepID=UPI00208E0A2F|nr:coagulase domain-containing protein [Staphylococcus hyicus]MCO4329897.1 hypothetical protein [Staphylococcus hyicus]